MAFIKEVMIKAGDWRTVEYFWNAKGTLWFRGPRGVQIKVRYGLGFLGFDSQEQSLDGNSLKTLSVDGILSVAYARVQVRGNNVEVAYEYAPGFIGDLHTPPIPF